MNAQCTYLRGLALVLVMMLGSTGIEAWAQAVSAAELEQRGGLYYKKGSDVPFTGDMKDEMSGRIEDGLRVGEWVSWHENGEKDSSVQYEKGKISHLIRWHPNGVKGLESTYNEGRPHGQRLAWYENGTQQSVTNYVDGQVEGERKLWDLKGHLLLSAEYQSGKRHGATVWWYDNGQKRWETHYEEEARTGTWSQWDREGELFMQSEWAEGKLVKRHSPHEGH